MCVLQHGTIASDLSLSVTPGQQLLLHELSGKPVILASYPADWTPICGDQVVLYNELLPVRAAETFTGMTTVKTRALYEFLPALTGLSTRLDLFFRQIELTLIQRRSQ